MKSYFRNFFLPYEGNNYKAKFLHHSTLILLVLFIVVSTFLLNSLNAHFPQVLGIYTDITSEQLITLLNQKRRENNLPNLNLNPELSQAAEGKANDMLTKNYWAHNSPDGKTPWDFIKGAGYTYVYAGENLARGFTTSSDVTNAWLASPTHRANMMSSNYSDVGFAIVTGKLDGEDTVLVVEELGSRNLAVLPQPQNPQIQEILEEKPLSAQTVEKQKIKTPQSQTFVASSQVKNKPLIDSIHLTTNFSVFLVALIILTLISEMAILERRKIAGFARHNPDHILFLTSIIILMFILGRGVIL